jgi:serine/threonine-protein kinase
VTRLAPDLADRYRVERELGQRGMAIVRLAEDLKRERKAAIKVLHPDRSTVSCTLRPRLPGAAATTDIES